MMEYDVFGRRILIERVADRWRAWYAAGDGKRLEATDLRVPPDVPAEDLLRYLADHYHEHSSPARPDVRRVR